MKCKVLVITHGKLSEAFIETAKLILGQTDGIGFLNMPEQLNAVEYRSDIQKVIDENKKTGLLILTDVLGGSPFLTAAQLIKTNWDSVEVVTGCNLAMLLQIGTQIEDYTVSELKKIAIEAGKEGIIDLKERVGNR